MLLFLCVLSLGTGPVSIPAADVVDLLFNGSGEEGTEGKLGDSDLDRRAALVIVRELRPPRILLAVLVGASLALSGAVMQGFFQNPMADPYI
ncbi:MAG: iron chelate uptake ABC transporter family permease subunit, partial [Gemmatimonadetes bacterium]|nr:iron chelate uptake ABC transporter family permease subunit [Gemmatimonadota bacterium]